MGIVVARDGRRIPQPSKQPSKLPRDHTAAGEIPVLSHRTNNTLAPWGSPTACAGHRPSFSPTVIHYRMFQHLFQNRPSTGGKAAEILKHDPEVTKKQNPSFPHENKGLMRVARSGLEPELSDPESLVLPLHHQAEWFTSGSSGNNLSGGRMAKWWEVYSPRRICQFRLGTFF